MSANTLPAQLYVNCPKVWPLEDLPCTPVLILQNGFKPIQPKPENHSIWSIYNNVLNENSVNWALEIQTCGSVTCVFTMAYLISDNSAEWCTRDKQEVFTKRDIYWTDNK